MTIPWQQHADALLNYTVDFTDVLGGDPLISAEVAASDGVIVTAKQVQPTFVTFRLSGGTPGALATVTCRAITAGGLHPEAKPQIRILV